MPYITKGVARAIGQELGGSEATAHTRMWE